MSTRQIAKPETTHSNPHELFHLVADRIKHSANLLVESLPKNNPHAGRPDRMEPRNLRSSSIEHDAAQQFRRQRAIPLSIQRNFIFLFNLVARMGQLLSKIAAIRQKKQAFALSVEPTDIEKARELWRQQIENRVARVRIASS